MGVTRRRFTLEFRIEAAHRVIDSDRSVAEVARGLSLVEQTLAKWVREVNGVWLLQPKRERYVISSQFA